MAQLAKNLTKTLPGNSKNFNLFSRFTVITNTKFYYWYEENNYRENKLPLGYFDLKNLYMVDILTDGEIGGMENVFCIQVSSWYKKDIIRGPRKFYFSSVIKEEMYNWVITLNFLRVKAIYDEFTKNFGMINLPLLHEIRHKTKHRIKIKFNNKGQRTLGNKFSNNMYNAMARKSIISKSNQSYDGNSKDTSFNIQKSQNYSSMDVAGDDSENLDKIAKTKDLLGFVLNYGFASFIGFMQDIILNVDNVGINDEKIITIPQHINKLKNLELTKSILLQNIDG